MGKKFDGDKAGLYLIFLLLPILILTGFYIIYNDANIKRTYESLVGKNPGKASQCDLDCHGVHLRSDDARSTLMEGKLLECCVSKCILQGVIDINAC